MAFRDDRDALRAKGEVLEQEVSALKTELERTKGELAAQEGKDVKDEEELARLKSEVERLRRAAGETGPAPSGSKRDAERRGVAIVAVAGAVLIGAVALAVLPATTEPAPLPDTSGSSDLFGQPIPTPAPVPQPPPRNGLDTALFGAVVTEATGEAPAVGDGCVLDAELVPGGSLGRLRLVCRDVIYDSEDSGGMEVSMHESSFSEVSAGGGQNEHTYAVRYRDTGMRTGLRPEITVDTERGEIRVSRAESATATPLTATLRVEPWSVPRPGPPLATAPSPAPVAAPPAEDVRCDLDGAWRGSVYTESGESTRLTLAASRSTSTTVQRNGKTVHVSATSSEPVLSSPLPHPATIQLACEEARAVITAGEKRWEGRFGPGGATFLGRGVGAPDAMFWLRRLSDEEAQRLPGTSVNVDVNAIVEEVLGGRGR